MSDLTITPARRRLILIACMSAMFMTAVEATIVSTAMPTIAARLGGFSLFGWVFGSYLLAQAVTVPIYGRLADLYGRKRIFNIGASLFLVGSLLCGLAPSMLGLVLFRALQGLGAGAILPIAQTIVGDIYAPVERAKIQGYLSSIWGVSALVGPLLGAFIVQHLNWRLVFWINLPVGVVSLLLLTLFLTEESRHIRHALDLAGAALMALAAGSFMLGLLQAADLGWWLVPLFIGSGIAALLLVRQERRVAEPLVPVALWRDRAIVVGSIGSLINGCLIMGVIAYLPTYVQGVMGREPVWVGTTLTFMLFGWPAGVTLGSRLMVRTSYRGTAVLGGAVLIGGAVILAALQRDDGLWVPAAGALLTGLGMGLCSGTFLVAAQEAASRHFRGIATSSVLFMRMFGQAIGTAIFGAVLNLGLARRLPGIAGAVQSLMDPGQRHALPAPRLAMLVDAVARSLHEVYLLAVVFALAAFAVARLIPAGIRPGELGEAAAGRAIGD